jgi:hypothetical protein
MLISLNLEEVLEVQAAETEEKYVMTWTNSRNKTAVEENIFEMLEVQQS